ncbi:MAG: LysR family transcriptional regulator [Betaproteobacteria bacterium]
MELYQLRSFAAVAESGHLTRAADRLHISQPALSAQIKALEDELGVALFERHPSGMELTPAGRRLLPEAHKVVAAAQVLRSHASAFKGEVAGRVRVGTVSDPDFIRVGELLTHAVDTFPLLEIELHTEVSGAAFEKVRDGALDASFYYGNLTHPMVATLPLRSVAYRVVAPDAWRERVVDAPWDDIVAMPWVMTPPISTHSALAGELFREQGVSPARRVEADHEAVISSLVVAGLGVSLMREDLATVASAAGDVVLWGDQRLETTLSFIHLAERENEPVVHALREILGRVWTPAREIRTA